MSATLELKIDPRVLLDFFLDEPFGQRFGEIERKTSCVLQGTLSFLPYFRISHAVNEVVPGLGEASVSNPDHRIHVAAVHQPGILDEK
ncbi:hypothetical protein [Agrobacterium tumefaciens]|uniref:Uncharacterized protein n=1 Tax=Agrobacterium tumefaciens TaxID=358 RepID=A0AAW8M2I2_AGRTU|nr:hypothetical protein [Agrobacterium tumefaciens]MBP2542712.1 hypothetical protein [Agrobacterium tumefaciens]MBP2568746.1 hypothetical protein [Agrobacterium tumefaciens]MBP2574081.1 hypothetical protein [Agrobacterium tumefaciens]MDP9875670.1 hypothetical protein [Agrobacterium tumefaciens]MDP9980583.1 hypothetical protein [Agrobacterium tumefaciens]